MQTDDDAMGQLLRDAMATKVPELSPGFDARVLRRVRPRRLTPLGRVVIGVYVVVAAATAAWLMRELPVTAIAAAVVIGVPIAVGAGAYGRRLIAGQ
jgi:hypothetical protein